MRIISRSAAFVLLCFVSKFVHSQETTIVKISEYDQYLRIYKNCNCGDEIINDTTKLTFEKIPGKNKDTIVVKINGGQEMQYLIEPKLLKTKISGVEVDERGNSKLKTRKIKYYLAVKLN